MGKLFPRVLELSPLLTSTAELRFTSSLPVSAIFGLVYSAERDRYPEMEPLPAASLPPQLLIADPNFQFQAHYRLKPKDGSPMISVGPRTFAVATEAGAHIDLDYIKTEFGRLLKMLHGLNVITSYDRVGLRYINFFENQNVVKKSTFQLALEETDLSDSNVQMRVEMPYESFKAAINVMSEALVSNGPLAFTQHATTARKGSLIDIDVSVEPPALDQKSTPDQLIQIFGGAHEAAKKLFFKTLKDEFITELKPGY